jgi:tellurite resistance protein TerC
MNAPLLMWIAFGVVVVVMLAVDLKVFHKKAHEIKLAEAIVWSIAWIALSLAFNYGVYLQLGKDTALKFLTGYIIEKSLSMDNLFVFLLIFTYFGIPAEYQHKILFWGILGALLFRALFIAAGVTLIQTIAWTIYVLGAFLLFTGVRLAFGKEREFHPEKNIGIKVFKRFMPVTTDYNSGHFFLLKEGRRYATPMLVALIVLETTDIIFATDSIPAILGITVDPFTVYSSNIFAILGLRAMYFVLAGVMRLFRFLNYGLAFILAFVGAKMLTGDYIHMPVELELGIVGGILAVSILISILFPEKKSGESGTSKQS